MTFSPSEINGGGCDRPGWLYIQATDKANVDSQEFYDVSKHLFCSLEKWTVGPRKLELLLVNVHFRAAPNAVSLRKRQSRAYPSLDQRLP